MAKFCQLPPLLLADSVAPRWIYLYRIRLGFWRVFPLVRLYYLAQSSSSAQSSQFPGKIQVFNITVNLANLTFVCTAKQKSTWEENQMLQAFADCTREWKREQCSSITICSFASLRRPFVFATRKNANRILCKLLSSVYDESAQLATKSAII